MAQVIEFSIPDSGEPMDSARLLKWLVAPGEELIRGTPLLEMETDKSVIEVGAPGDGRLVEQLVSENTRFDPSRPVARIEFTSTDETEHTSASPPPPSAELHEVPVPAPHAQRIGTHDTRIFASPVARREMAAQAIGPEAVHGSGPDGRITLADVRAHASRATAENIGTFVQTTTGRMHVRFRAASTPRQGSATVVLVHGLFGDTDTWSSLISPLNREGLDVFSLDLPAHGQSESGANSFERIVDTLSETLMTLDGRPLTLVGHSFGGAVVSRLASLSTIDIRSVVLIAPLGLCTGIEQDFLAGMTLSRSQEALQRELAKLTADGAVPSATYVSRLSVRLAERRTLLQDICESISWNGVQQIDVRADLEKLTCPASLLQGRQDRIIPWKGALNAPPRVGLHLLPGVGHMPHWEAPALTSDVILRAAI
ncbi:MAG: alpha/beta fold hydrolase [Lautropia sp.]|nr:alpha/beta fold hydrolase [Lautropia sp.]